MLHIAIKYDVCNAHNPQLSRTIEGPGAIVLLAGCLPSMWLIWIRLLASHMFL